MFYFTDYISPIGLLTVASDGTYINGLWLDGQKYFLDTLPEMPKRNDDLDVFDNVRCWLNRYFAGKNPEISELPLKPIGGKFRQSVWKCLCEIPYGKTTTYGAIAKRIAAESGKEKNVSTSGGRRCRSQSYFNYHSLP